MDFVKLELMNDWGYEYLILKGATRGKRRNLEFGDLREEFRGWSGLRDSGVCVTVRLPDQTVVESARVWAYFREGRAERSDTCWREYGVRLPFHGLDVFVPLVELELAKSDAETAMLPPR